MATQLELTDEEAEALRCLLFGWQADDSILNRISDRLGLPTDPETGQLADPREGCR